MLRRRAVAILRRTGLSRAGIGIVRGAVAITVTHAAAQHDPLFGTREHFRAAAMFGQAPLLGADVCTVGDAIRINIPMGGAAIAFDGTGFSDTGIHRIGHKIGVRIGAALSQRRAGRIGAVIHGVRRAIAITVSFRDRRAATRFRHSGGIRTGVGGIRGAIRVPVRAAAGNVEARLVGTGICLIRHTIGIPVSDHTHTDRRMVASANAIERPDHDRMSAGGGRLPLCQQRKG